MLHAEPRGQRSHYRCADEGKNCDQPAAPMARRQHPGRRSAQGHVPRCGSSAPIRGRASRGGKNNPRRQEDLVDCPLCLRIPIHRAWTA